MADNPETKAPQEPGRTAVQEGTARVSEAGRAGNETVQRTSTATAETMRHLGDAAGETVRSGWLARRMSWVRMRPDISSRASAEPLRSRRI